MKSLKVIAAIAVCALASQAQAAHDFQNPNDNKFTCKVVGVLDGDTIDCYGSGKKVRVRLAEIDAPEKTQAYGQKAKQLLSSLAYGKTVTVNYSQLPYGAKRFSVVL